MKYWFVIIESFGTYFYLVLMLRILGKKEMSQLTITDFIVFLLISELMTLCIGDNGVTFLMSACAVLSLIVVDKVCSYISLKNKKIKKVLEGKPSYLIIQGELNQKEMKRLNYSINDLFQQLRTQGIVSIEDIAYAVLEIDGQISVIQSSSSLIVPEPLIQDGEFNDDVLKVIGKNRQWVIEGLNGERVEDIFYCSYENNRFIVVKR